MTFYSISTGRTARLCAVACAFVGAVCAAAPAPALASAQACRDEARALVERAGDVVNTAEGQKQLAAAARLCTKARARTPGDPEIVHALGKIALLQKRFEDAARYLRDAVGAGSTSAQFTLALFMHKGILPQRHDGEAIAIMADAATDGVLDAQVFLGKGYLTGAVGAQDFTKAAHWLDKAAAQDHPVSTYLLGDLYFSGRGVEKDIAHGVRLMGRAAKNGMPHAAYTVGLLYLSDKMGAPDVERAVEWLTIAADGTDLEAVMAQQQLGELYIDGEHLPRDVPEATKWLCAAKRNGARRNAPVNLDDYDLMYGVTITCDGTARAPGE